MTLIVVGSFDEIKEHHAAWNASADALGLPLARVEWLAAAARHIAAADKVKIYLLLDLEAKFRAGIALETTRDSQGQLRHYIVGSILLYEPNALVYRDTQSRDLLLKSISRLSLPTVLLRCWEMEQTTLKTLPRAINIKRSSAPSQYIDIQGEYTAFFETLSSQRRYDIRRATRRAEELGKLNIQLLFPAPDQIPALLEQANRIEASSWKGKAGTALSYNENMHRFFCDALSAFAYEKACYFAFLHIDENIVAMQFGVYAQQRFWILKIGYDESYSKASPGLLLMNELVRLAYERSDAGIEFLGSSEPWIRTWNPQQRYYAAILIYPLRIRSLTQLVGDVSSAVYKRLILKLQSKQK